MQVTKIEELSKSRCKVYLDQELAFILYKGELRSLQVKEGKPFSEDPTGRSWKRCCQSGLSCGHEPSYEQGIYGAAVKG